MKLRNSSQKIINSKNKNQLVRKRHRLNSKYLTFKYSTILSLEQIEKSLNKPLRQGRRMLFYGGVLSKDFGDHS